MPFSEEKLTTSKPTHDNTMDSAVVPETPKEPRGILKQNDVSHKKRRVAFAGSDEQRTSSSEEGDEKQVLNLIKVFLPFIFCLCHPCDAFSIFNADAKLQCILYRLKQLLLNLKEKESVKKRIKRVHHERMLDFLRSHLLGTMNPQSKRSPYLRKCRN